jgi:hypothetical protein
VNVISNPDSEEQGSVFITIGLNTIVPLDDYVDFRANNAGLFPGYTYTEPQSIYFKGIPAYQQVVSAGGYNFNYLILDANSNRYEISNPILPGLSSTAMQRVIESFEPLGQQ